MTSEWKRVTRAAPCVVCKKPDWCTYTADGAICCMRIQSDRPAHNGGWMHGTSISHAMPRLTKTSNTPHATRDDLSTGRTGDVSPRYEEPAFNAALWWEAARNVTTRETLGEWSVGLGLGADLLDWMGAATACEILTFPMHDGDGAICGIRTREPGGQKRAVTGSRAGVFLPMAHLAGLDVLITEGPTDACAAMALGFEPIGRPSCQGCERHIIDTLKRWGINRATVCADSDGPGISGAGKLIDVLAVSHISTRLVTCNKHKDLRDWFRSGATRKDVDMQWSQAKWR